MRSSRLCVVACVALLAAAGRAQVPNDTCATATLIDEGVVSGTNVGAQTNLPVDGCNILKSPMVKDVWYRFEPVEKGWLRATFGCAGADFDTGLFFFESCAAGTFLECNDDYCFLNSQLEAMVLPSQPLLIAVAGLAQGLGDQGPFKLKVTVDRVSQFITAATVVADGVGGFASHSLTANDDFGEVAALGELDRNGVSDVAVGAPGDDNGGSNAGAVWLLEQSVEGTVLAQHKLSNTFGGLSGLPAGGAFGSSLAGLGDLDGDGTPDLAVGSPLEDVGSPDAGVIRIIFLRPNGTVKSVSKIGAGLGGFAGLLHAGDRFGAGLAAIGDVDGDGVVDLAVGAEGDDDGSADAGAVWILLLQPNGTVKANVKLSATAGGFGGPLHPGDNFGTGLGAAGDIDGDGVPDLVVGAPFGGPGDQGLVWTVLLDANGTAKADHAIDLLPGFNPDPPLTSVEYGAAVCSLGDWDGDGVPDLAIGAPGVEHVFSSTGQGVVFRVLLDSDGSPRDWELLTDPSSDSFFFEQRLGRSLSPTGDVDGDGHDDLLVGDSGPSPLFSLQSFMTLFIDSTNAWTTLTEGGLAGENSYAPELRGEGPLTAGSPWSLELAIAKRFSPATFVVGLSTLSAPFKGGVLVPSPNVVLSGFQTSGQGRIGLQGLWPAGVPSGSSVWVQAWVVDNGGPAGLAASNAVLATTP